MRKYLPQQLITLAQRTGRWIVTEEQSDQPLLYTTNLGSYLRCRIQNSRHFTLMVANQHHPLGPSHVFAIRVDNQPWQRFSARSGKIPLAVTPDTHDIEVMAAGNSDLDDVWTGDQGFAIRSISIDDSGTLAAAPLRPVINFIGDSITAGCWVAGRTAAFDYRPESNYSAICADLLNVDSLRIAYSAGGVLRPATGGVPVASSFLPQINQSVTWIPNQPQLVVINLGVNDRRYPLARFVAAYDHFIQQVITTFDSSKVILMVPFSQHFKEQINAIGQHYQLPVIDTANWCPSYTDGLHPDQAGSRAAGRQLAQVLSPYFVKKV